MITLPPVLDPVLQELAQHGRPRIVGGCVRDALLGHPSDDIDIEVGGIDFDGLESLLKPFGATDVVGRSFGTIKLHRSGEQFDFSLPRRESKTGAGHRGFKVNPDPYLSDAEAAARRDFTVNAMAWDPVAGELIDPLGGREDMANRVLRHCGPAFREDPLRVLRGMQLAARFDFELAPETAELARSMQDDFGELPVERVWGEWDKWATRSIRPSRGLRVLQQTGWLAHFPEIAALVNTPQEPEWHPEGDVFEHTCHCLDALVKDLDWSAAPAEKRRRLMLAVLCHDLGKPSTTERVEKNGRLRWTSPGHAHAGIEPTRNLLARIGASPRLLPFIEPLVQYHLAHIDSGSTPPSASQIRRLARKLAPATLEELLTVMRADCRGRPPKDDPETLARLDQMAAKAEELAVKDAAPKPLLGGRDLIARGFEPGPQFGRVLAEAYEAQLAGEFDDEVTSQTWLDSHLKHTKN